MWLLNALSGGAPSHLSLVVVPKSTEENNQKKGFTLGEFKKVLLENLPEMIRGRSFGEMILV